MPASKASILRWFLFVLMAVAFAAAWTVAFSFTRRAMPWLALLAAVDAVVAARLLGIPRGTRGAVGGGLFVLIAVALSSVAIAAVSVGGPTGFGLVESLSRLGPTLAWELVQLATGLPQLLLYVIAAELAAWWCHGR
ncbi:hypothetical protein [Solilutibacter silvestris]|uniref:Uncharacterized protein n=1 Tax=Solilutibacter silvestris TaxID=1645665 RepID=A0A2K1PXM3_9GAMM|nr:hypothetical protein [Lysobacter silvestris]PNS07539.1 hypothetical protein Lysil_1715 [Lysobacter silvestris]